MKTEKGYSIISGDRYIVKRIYESGLAIVVNKHDEHSCLYMPCMWNEKNRRLECVAINVTKETKVPLMYSVSKSIKKFAERNAYMLLTEKEARNKIAHIPSEKEASK
ncbi:MAG TPA: hypothetical protein PLA71_00960 [Saccharofermentans sp.]|nr:hypothetical protein [Saccharofermentans sp.]